MLFQIAAKDHTINTLNTKKLIQAFEDNNILPPFITQIKPPQVNV